MSRKINTFILKHFNSSQFNYQNIYKVKPTKITVNYLYIHQSYLICITITLLYFHCNGWDERKILILISHHNFASISQLFNTKVVSTSIIIFKSFCDKKLIHLWLKRLHAINTFPIRIEKDSEIEMPDLWNIMVEYITLDNVKIYFSFLN